MEIKMQIVSEKNLIGCVHRLTLNERQVDFLQATTRPNTFEGCYLGDAANVLPVASEPDRSRAAAAPTYDACLAPSALGSGPRCANGGRCVSDASIVRGFRCECRPGFRGARCEQEPACRRSEYFETFVEPGTGCRSARAVRHPWCEGGCGAYCCRPVRYETQPVRVLCADGSAHWTAREIVTHCGCKTCSLRTYYDYGDQ